MSAEKKQRQQFDRFGTRDFVQTIQAPLGAAAGTQSVVVARHGVTVIESTGTGAGTNAWTLAEPVKGVRKTIVMHGPGGQLVDAIVQTNSSAVTVGETTGNRITFSTTAGLDGSAVSLIGLSSVAWVIAADLPAGVTISAATQAV